VVVWLVDRLIDSLPNRTGRKQTAVWPGCTLQKSTTSHAPGFDRQPSASTSLFTVTARHRLPHTHTHTIPRSFLHVRQQGVRQVDEAHSDRYDQCSRSKLASHPLRRERMCDTVHERWRFGFLQSSQPPISFLNGFFRYYGPCYCCSYIVLTTVPPQLPTSAYRFPLPAYNNATRRHAVRTNGVGLSVCRSSSRTSRGARPICHRTLSISPLFLETPLDRYV
jgi:hypothetical protein